MVFILLVLINVLAISRALNLLKVLDFQLNEQELVKRTEVA